MPVHFLSTLQHDAPATMSAGAQTGKPATKDPQPRARPGRGPEKYANIDACLQRGCATNETDAQTATPQPTTTLARR